MEWFSEVRYDYRNRYERVWDSMKRLAWLGLLAGVVLTFARVLGKFGAILIETEKVITRIYRFEKGRLI